MPELNYTPDGKVLRAFMRSDAFVRGIRGPVGSGKTACCCIELFRRSASQAPSTEDKKRHTRHAVIRNTQPELKTTTIKTWLDWFPEAEWGRFNWQPPFTHHIRAGDIDMEVIFLALDSDEDVKKLYSLEVTMAWVNEARFVPRSVLKTLTERVNRYPSMRIGGPSFAGIIMDTNAMDPDHWWPIMSGEMPIPDDVPEEDRLMLTKPAGWEFFNQPGAMLEVKDGEGRTVGWEPNPEAENVRNLPTDYYQNQLAGKTRAEIQRNIGNKLVVVKEGKAVYPSFDEDTHLSNLPLAIIPGADVYVGQDFGLTPAAVIGQRLRGRWLIQRELVSTSMGAKRFGEELKHLLARDYPDSAVHAYGDPAGDQRAQTDEITPFMIFEALGVPILPAPSNDFVLRVEAVENQLRKLVDGRPAVLIDPSCRHLRKAMAGGYHYPKIQVSGTTRYADRPMKNDSSHVAEALQYLLMGAGEGHVLLKRPRRYGPGPQRARSRTWDVFARHQGGRSPDRPRG